MKKLMILGAMLGFGGGAILSLLQGASPGVVLWRATISSVVAAYLFRWWGRIWIRALHDAHADRASASQMPASRN
ncbi:MAG TPA: hypothetical protein VEH27_13390 [Methylomirabilota bacterium]|nr:hypothetical protein [Methylomirabilota bacterium]